MSNILTHNGCITIKNPKTGNHRTFQIKTKEFPDGSLKRVLYILIGPDNTNDYLPIGFVGKTDIYIWKRHQNTLYEKTAKCLLKIEELGLISRFETKCRVCNRRLTTPESCELGYGPICVNKINLL